MVDQNVAMDSNKVFGAAGNVIEEETRFSVSVIPANAFFTAD